MFCLLFFFIFPICELCVCVVSSLFDVVAFHFCVFCAYKFGVVVYAYCQFFVVLVGVWILFNSVQSSVKQFQHSLMHAAFQLNDVVLLVIFLFFVLMRLCMIFHTDIITEGGRVLKVFVALGTIDFQ